LTHEGRDTKGTPEGGPCSVEVSFGSEQLGELLDCPESNYGAARLLQSRQWHTRIIGERDVGSEDTLRNGAGIDGLQQLRRERVDVVGVLLERIS